MTAPPKLPGTRRAIPRYVNESQAQRLRELIDQSEGWVLRPDWSHYLSGRDVTMIPIGNLTRDQRVASLAWLEQQRHHLHRAIEGDAPAPDGWLERRALYRALADGA